MHDAVKHGPLKRFFSSYPYTLFPLSKEVSPSSFLDGWMHAWSGGIWPCFLVVIDRIG